MEAPQLYKHMHRQYAEDLCDRGMLRISTLGEYRQTERHNEAVGDAEEGSKGVFYHPELVDYSEPSTVPDYARRIIRAPDGANVQLFGCTLAESGQHPDVFVFCMCEDNKTATMRKLGCVTTVMIEITPFLRDLTNHLQSLGLVHGMHQVGKCVYKPRIAHHTNPNPEPPVLLKDPRYEYQREVRAFWVPTSASIKPVQIQYPPLSAHCKLT